MKQKCIGCPKLTKYTFLFFTSGNKYVPLCKKCKSRSVSDQKLNKKRDSMAKGRSTRWICSVCNGSKKKHLKDGEIGCDCKNPENLSKLTTSKV